MSSRIKCVICGETDETKLDRHHVYPTCHYKRGRHNLVKVWICMYTCHPRLEGFIRKREGGHINVCGMRKRIKHDKPFYMKCFLDFQKENQK